MQIYLVGGAVRDKLLNRKTVDKDYVVIGATTQEMLQKGFRQVGKDFPVFLHPSTNDEYALARTERKKGVGHKGFECDASPNVTLEQDLQRRDLTINAMAMDTNGNIIDPFGGQRDLNNKILRHVSPAFAEDPLRVFRAARFAARFAHLGFSIDRGTLDIMRKIAGSGELKTLSANRVWQESARALLEQSPTVFFSVLYSVDALKDWFTELEYIWQAPENAKDNAMPVLQTAIDYSDAIEVRYSALILDLVCATSQLSSNEQQSSQESIRSDDQARMLINEMNERLGPPNACRILASLTAEHYLSVHTLFEQSSKDILTVLDKVDAWRKPERFQQFLVLCRVDYCCRSTDSSKQYEQVSMLEQIYERCAKIAASPFVEKGMKGIEIKNAINEQRLDIIQSLMNKDMQ